MEGVDPADAEGLIGALEENHQFADLGDADVAILDYAAKLTRHPDTIRAADIERLRDAGLNDRAIHDLCAITAYFAFVNRIADGLGVQVEPGVAE